MILRKAMEAPKGEISLEELKNGIETMDQERSLLLPSVEIFREIMVELLREREIHMDALREERRNYISEISGGFQLNEMLLNLEDAWGERIQMIEAYRIEDGKVILFDNVPDGTGRRKTIRCSNVLIRVRRE